MATHADGNDETRLFRVGPRGEFLEARIVPQRIEHWTEPLPQNFFAVVASNGEVIDSISLSAISGFGFTDLRQVRISGATVPSVPETGTTLSLLGASVLALALLRRKLVCLADGSGT